MGSRLDDPRRLGALARAEIMDTAPEEVFDRLTRLATKLLGAPVALVSLVDDERQFFKSRIGLAVEQTPLSHSFCQHVVTDQAPLVIADAREDPRLRENLAIDGLGVIAYCGVPLIDGDGQTLGSFCAIDGQAREWSEEDVAVLRELAASVMTEFELRAAYRELHRREELTAESEEQLRLTFDGAPIGIAVIAPDGHWLKVNRALAEIVGYTQEELLGLTFQQITHPDDLGDDLELLALLLAGEIPSYTLHKRYLHKRGHEIWVKLAVSLVRDAFRAPRHLVAHVEDVSAEFAAEAARYEVEERQRVLLSSLPDTMVVLYDRGLRVTLLQGALLAEREIDPDDCLGRPLVEFVSPQEYDRLEPSVRRALTGEADTIEFAADNGATYQIDVAPFRGGDGQISGAFTVWRDISGRLEREAQTRRLATMVHQSEDAIIAKDRDGVITEWNRGAERLYGYAAAEAVGQPISMIVAPERIGEGDRLLRRALAGEVLPVYETTRLHKNGGLVEVSISVTPIHDARDEIVGASVIARDITARIREQEARREIEQRLQVTVDHAPIGVALVDLDTATRGRILSANDAFRRLVGDPDPVGASINIAAFAHPDEVEPLMSDLSLLSTDAGARTEREIRCLHSDGHVSWMLIAGAAVPGARDDSPRQAVLHCMDIGERKRFEGQLQYLADHDTLTGLYNRRRFEEELERALARVRRYAGSASLLMIDLDGFKYVNDTLGHSVGDELVTRLGAILRGTLRQTDVIARLGGDEFAVVLTEADAAQATAAAQKLLKVIADGAIAVDDHRHARVTASIGITTFGQDSERDHEELLIEADIAMYEAKEAGKNQAVCYRRDGVDRSTLTARDSWLERLQLALDEGHFVLLAQPIRGICADGIDRYELLLRLRGDDGELIPPGAFLYNAERFDLIQRIDRWVFAEALQLLRVHQENGDDISLSVNMSAKTLGDPRIVSDVAAMIAACPIPRGRLVVEVTETAAIVNIDKAKHVARELRALGCQFALDDFGAGFASFYYLKHLDFDYVKIDGEFVKSLTENPTDQLVVKSVVDIARGLGAQTIAEFVGDDDAIRHLRRLGVDYGQGYHLGRPAALSDVLPTLTV